MNKDKKRSRGNIDALFIFTHKFICLSQLYSKRTGIKLHHSFKQRTYKYKKIQNIIDLNILHLINLF